MNTAQTYFCWQLADRLGKACMLWRSGGLRDWRTCFLKLGGTYAVFFSFSSGCCCVVSAMCVCMCLCENLQMIPCVKYLTNQTHPLCTNLVVEVPLHFAKGIHSLSLVHLHKRNVKCHQYHKALIYYICAQVENLLCSTVVTLQWLWTVIAVFVTKHLLLHI